MGFFCCLRKVDCAQRVLFKTKYTQGLENIMNTKDERRLASPYIYAPTGTCVLGQSTYTYITIMLLQAAFNKHDHDK